MRRINHLFLLAFISGCYTQVDKERQGVLYPEPFEVEYQFGDNLFNSVACSVRKDLVMDGYATAMYCLTDFDKYRIWRILREMDIENFPERAGKYPMLGTRYLTLRIGNIEKHMSWDIADEDRDDIQTALRELENVFREILDPVFLALPPSRGGRL